MKVFSCVMTRLVYRLSRIGDHRTYIWKLRGG